MSTTTMLAESFFGKNHAAALEEAKKSLAKNENQCRSFLIDVARGVKQAPDWLLTLMPRYVAPEPVETAPEQAPEAESEAVKPPVKAVTPKKATKTPKKA
jgi:hypothetical protein